MKINFINLCAGLPDKQLIAKGVVPKSKVIPIPNIFEFPNILIYVKTKSFQTSKATSQTSTQREPLRAAACRDQQPPEGLRTRGQPWCLCVWIPNRWVSGYDWATEILVWGYAPAGGRRPLFRVWGYAPTRSPGVGDFTNRFTPWCEGAKEVLRCHGP
jgi:hypothetical protein